MSWIPELRRYSGFCLVAVGAALLGACSPTPVVSGPSPDPVVDEVDDGGKTDTSSARVYASPAGTSGLSIGLGSSGAAALASFDPGAFVRSTSAAPASSADDSLSPAEVGDPPPPPPPPPPPDDGGAPPPPPPPPDDGGTPPPPPPDDGGAPPPPDDGGNPPPPDGDVPPPPDGDSPPFDPNNPPPDGDSPPFDPNNPPPDGDFPPFDPNNPPPDGDFPPFDPNNPPPDGDFPPFDPNNPPPDGDFPPFDPNGPPPDGGFPPPFDPENPPPPPPPLGPGDTGWVPPPPPEGWDGVWVPPPPEGDVDAGDWVPPPPEDLYGQGEWFPPPPPPGWEGEWYPPPPPPEGMNNFPDGFYFADTFDEFFTDEFFAEQGSDAGPPPFNEFPFEAFLEDHSLYDIIPDLPPQLERGMFGEFEFGAVPPPPPGFPPFPPPPEFLAAFGSAFGGPPPFDPNNPPPDGVPPDGPPPNLPPEFFEFGENLAALDAFMADFAFPPPPGDGDGPFPPGEGPFPPGDGVGEGGPPPGLGFVAFAQIAEFLPPGFLPPEDAVAAFDNFGADHPLIGDGGVVNPDLEAALDEFPPVPEGFDGFDFTGDAEQFDDLFTQYDEQQAGESQRGQVNTTLTEVLDDGTEVRCIETTVIETVQEEATPLVEMGDGVYQTQWVVNIHELTSSSVQYSDPENPDATPVAFEQSKETLSQMTWTVILQEVDTDGDGVPDEILVSGGNEVVIMEETSDGDAPEGAPPVPPSPDLVLPLNIEGVLDLGAPG